jgi:hypothetical protein
VYVTTITTTIIKILLLLLFCESSEGGNKLRVPKRKKMLGISLLAKKLFASQKGLYLAKDFQQYASCTYEY